MALVTTLLSTSSSLFLFFVSDGAGDAGAKQDSISTETFPFLCLNGSDLCLSIEPFNLVATVLVIGLCLLGEWRISLDLAVLGVAGESTELKRRVDLRGVKDCGVRGIGAAGEEA